MTQFANAQVGSTFDGTPYALNKPMPALEGSLFNQNAPLVDPVPTLYNESILAIVQFNVVAGPLGSNTSYVILQTDLGDGVWLDVAWCTFTGLSGNAQFGMSNGVAGANVFQQTRAAGTAPSPANGSNQCQLGGRFRFVGKASVGSSSSSSSGAPGPVPGVNVTIKYKQLGLR